MRVAFVLFVIAVLSYLWTPRSQEESPAARFARNTVGSQAVR